MNDKNKNGISVPDTLLTCYGRHLGPDGVGYFLYLAHRLEHGLTLEPGKHLGIGPDEERELMARLEEAGLLETFPIDQELLENDLLRAIFDGGSEYRLYEPLSREEFAREFHDADWSLGCATCRTQSQCTAYKA